MHGAIRPARSISELSYWRVARGTYHCEDSRCTGGDTIKLESRGTILAALRPPNGVRRIVNVLRLRSHRLQSERVARGSCMYEPITHQHYWCRRSAGIACRASAGHVVQLNARLLHVSTTGEGAWCAPCPLWV